MVGRIFFMGSLTVFMASKARRYMFVTWDKIEKCISEDLKKTPLIIFGNACHEGIPGSNSKGGEDIMLLVVWSGRAWETVLRGVPFRLCSSDFFESRFNRHHRNQEALTKSTIISSPRPSDLNLSNATEASCRLRWNDIAQPKNVSDVVPSPSHSSSRIHRNLE